MRLGWTEEGVTELVGVTEHVTGLNKVAMGLLIEPDIGRQVDDSSASLVGLAAPEGELRELFDEIQQTEQRRLGVMWIPNFWRVLGLNHPYLKATWKKDQFLMAEDGALDADIKWAIGLAVSMTNGCRYFIEYYARAFRQRGFDDDAILQVAAVVDLYNSYNKVADGFLITSEEAVKQQLG